MEAGAQSAILIVWALFWMMVLSLMMVHPMFRAARIQLRRSLRLNLNRWRAARHRIRGHMLRFRGRCKRLADGVWKIGRKLVHSGWDIVVMLVGRVLDGFEWLFERGKSSYEKLEPRLMAQATLLSAWWERRGWPIGILQLLGNGLLFLPVDLCWYLLACVEHLVGLNPYYLLTWLIFAGSIRAGRFYFKEILPDQRALRSVGKAENGTQREEGV